MKTEIKVLGAVAMALLATELVFRPLETFLSLDVAHIRSIPEVADAVSKPRGEGVKRVLFMGNSLTRSGVDDGKFVESMGGKGIGVSTFFIYPDGSSITPWTYLYRDQFVRRGISPDVLVVGFGRSHLRDGPTDPSVLALYAGGGDVGRVLTEEVANIDAGIAFLFAKGSVAFAHRNRVQPRVFSEVLPYYQEAFTEINALRMAEARRSMPKGSEEAGETYSRLEEFLALAAGQEMAVVFVALPTAEPYPLSGKVEALIRTRGAKLLDFRGLPGIGADDFPDGYHLGERGAALLTEALVEGLRNLLRRISVPEAL